MAYKLPDKTLLEETNPELDNKKYYSLAKITFKKDLDNKLLFPIGQNSDDKYYVDLEEKSSMLIIGETGSGKSVYLHSIIISLLLKNTPNELKFVFIDPRGVEFKVYENIPHLLTKPISSKADSLWELDKIKKELDKRRELFIASEVKNIKSYNEKVEDKLPRIMVMVDEAIDIIEDKDFEDNLLELITDGSRYGIHIIIATSSYLRKRLSTFFLRSFNYILSFDLASPELADYVKISGADLLTVYGEALVRYSGNKTLDLQTPYVSDNDINNIVNFINKQK